MSHCVHAFKLLFHVSIDVLLLKTIPTSEKCQVYFVRLEEEMTSCLLCKPDDHHEEMKRNVYCLRKALINMRFVTIIRCNF